LKNVEISQTKPDKWSWITVNIQVMPPAGRKYGLNQTERHDTVT